MTITTKFENLCSNIRISKKDADNISARYREITKRLNRDYYGTESEISHSLYVGSYGRDTDIHVSDIDMIFQIPYSSYKQYDNYIGNGQSALLNEVKNILQKRYKTSHIKGDGQVVQISFDDGIIFEIVPVVLLENNKGYWYPDTNNGGSWKTTNPKAEIEEIRDEDSNCNGNLKRLCRMLRQWKETCSVPLGGLLIDTFAYNFLKNWKFKDKSFLYYDFMTRDFFDYLSDLDDNQDYWLAPGSSQRVNRKGAFKYKATQAYNRALEAIEFEKNGSDYSANLKWKEIYGTKFNG